MPIVGGRLKRTLAGGTLALLLTVPAAASAATITPNTTADETGGACSLRDAISSANNNTNQGGCAASGTYGDDTIPLPAGTYTLSIPPDGTPDDNADGDLDIGGLGNLTISHSGLDPATIDAAGIDRVLHIGSPTAATISGVTIRNGRAATGSSGGGIRNEGTLTLSNSTINANFTAGTGGGMTNAGTANLTNVTISANAAGGPGGGLGHSAATPLTTLNNVTVTGNTADADADANGDGGGISRTSGTLNLGNTIVAGNTDATPAPGTVAPDCASAPTSLGHNLIGNTANCGYTPSTGDIVGVAPLLGPLADNGGPTPTHGLPLSSPAVDKGSSSLAADQRAFLRPVDFPEVANSTAGGNAADMGAFELQRATCKGQTATHIAAAGIPLIGTDGPDVIIGSDGADVIRSRGGRDLVCAEGAKDKVNGGTARDRIFGQKGRDRLKGKRGKDKLVGGKKKDVLKGGNGKDKLKGGKGPDVLKGGKGRDVCKGGKGDDTAAACEVEKGI